MPHKGGREVLILENLLDTSLPTKGRLFPTMTVDKVVKRYAFLRRQIPELHGTGLVPLAFRKLTLSRRGTRN